MKNQYIIILFALIFSSCEKTILLDLKQVPQKVAIEALVTDAKGRQYVKVTRNAGFYDNGETIRITDAVVAVSDNLGESVAFLHNPRGHQDSSGYYLPATDFSGVVGRIYSLTVATGGNTYTASDTLRHVTGIDSLGYRPNPFLVRNKPDDGKTYELLIFAKEPQDTKDYYFIKYYRNDSLKYNRDTDVYLFDDYGVGENIDGVPSNVYYAIGDTARMEMYSLTRTSFIFYNDLLSILNSDGGMFSPPPANPRTNISNGGLGFFQVSAVTSRQVILKDLP